LRNVGTEQAVVIPCAGEHLTGILHVPATLASDRGVLLVVGGPQYRVGSHRQFVLLARALAADGIATLRFDHRGIGDSDGASRAFSDLHEDLRCAANHLMQSVPQLRSLVIWGLCDAASAALLYAPADSRVSGLVLLNPWVRNPEAQARALLRTYYLRRIFSRELWRSLLSGRVAVLQSLRELAGFARRAVAAPKESVGAAPAVADSPVVAPDPQFVQRMRDGFARFRGPVLLIMSGEDLTAQEFRELTRSSREWRKLLAEPRLVQRDFPEANHTFSRAVWRDQVARWTSEWIRA
jgi:uncharacterized protein